LVSDFGMSNYLDFPSYEELVEMYQANLTNNDRLYDSRNDRQLTHDSKHIPKRRRPTTTSLKEKIAGLNLLIELDITNQSYQEVKDELINEIVQLDLTITELQDKVANLNKIAEVLLNLNNSDPENRRLARYDYAKMNLTSAIRIENVQLELYDCTKQLDDYISIYEYSIRNLEEFHKLLFDYSSGVDSLHSIELD
ncbi:helical hairpin domain-containing protein, partial [Streptococcus sp. E24BD]|uniref:helical hairpin domain-containing protein n=1 Tax=Streptococcus sp. E24BD TaxID=3278715 RepID=UPI00359E5819